MEIIIAKNSGLCYGVKRALKLARRTRLQKNGPVFTFGDLIHNPRVIDDLKEEGIQAEDHLDNIHEGTVIIRSHGVSPQVYEILEKKNIDIVDATCPIVKNIQKRVENLANQVNQIIIVGNREHPETRGLSGYSRGKGIVVEEEEQVKALPFKKTRAVLAQSTQDFFLFQKIVSLLMEKTEELRVFNTICESTQTRQRSTSELASSVDRLFIVGGKNSSNTHKLYQISKRILPQTFFIEKAEQITPEMIRGAKKIGLSGGASTPPEAIHEAVQKIKMSLAHQPQREKTAL
ncbi:MAG: 4-hydroxy-3-methylbut-2-enyl diphosphate reductase [Candidatus Aminicenantes bacterium]